MVDLDEEDYGVIKSPGFSFSPEVIIVDTVIRGSEGEVVTRVGVEFNTANICLGLTFIT